MVFSRRWQLSVVVVFSESCGCSVAEALVWFRLSLGGGGLALQVSASDLD